MWSYLGFPFRRQSRPSQCVRCHIQRLRYIHARREQTPYGERTRKVDRPLDRFDTSDKVQPGVNHFGLSPTTGNLEGRSDDTAKQRKSMQYSRSPEQLLGKLQNAVTEARIDVSVFAAAMQRCGQGRWWDCLLLIPDLQKKAGVRPNGIQLCIYLTALTRCLKTIQGEKSHDVLQMRLETAVRLGKEFWDEIDPEDRNDINPSLSAALRLCASARHDEAFLWAEALWLAAPPDRVNSITYEAYLLLLATHALHEQVDDLLVRAAHRLFEPSCVSLGALVNAAGEQHDAERVDEVWQLYTLGLGVEPHMLAFVAKAKAHLLCGQPAESVKVLEEMASKGHPLNIHGAQLLVQALAVVYHSSLNAGDRARLVASMQKFEQAVQAEPSSVAKGNLEKLEAAVNKLFSRPESLRLHDILVDPNAQRSCMLRWASSAPGSRYVKCDTSDPLAG
eukprot:TRINITY_DN26221_c0_g1_i4.p1 TRINITY_DN26221_c0_g1~~TRINITY_DN26221_c0_g1_i4.p1  ORF type:complete len:480 (+),score=53.48 TRINITY_DN26221_c0_g1_i4:97-1440(+)